MKKRLVTVAIALLMLFSNVFMPTVSAWLIQGRVCDVSCSPFSALIMNGYNVQVSTNGTTWANSLNKADLSAEASNSIPEGTNSLTPVSFNPVTRSFAGGAYNNGSFSAASAAKGTYMKLTFYIKSDMSIVGEIIPTFESDMNYAYAAISTGTNTTIYNRNTGRNYIPIVNAGSTGLDTNGNKVMEQGEIDSSSLGENVTASNSAPIFIALPANTAMAITVYIWLEIQDYACANAVATPNFNFDLLINLDGGPSCGLTGSYSTSSDVTGSLLLSSDTVNWYSKLDEIYFEGIAGNSFPAEGSGLVPVSFNPANRSFMAGCLNGNYDFCSSAMTAASGEYIKYTVYAKLPYSTGNETDVVVEPTFLANFPFIYAAINDGVHTFIYNSISGRSYFPIVNALSGYDTNRNEIMDASEISTGLGPAVIASSPTPIHLTFTPGEIKELTVYVWAEGQDPSCAGVFSSYTAELDLLFSAPEKTMSGIEIAALPTKTTYTAGDTLDTTGLTLLATFDDGTTTIISDGFTCSPTVLNTAGMKTITVDYNGLSATFTVAVLTNAPAGLTSPGKTDTSVSLAWTAVSGATGYNVYIGSTKVNTTLITAANYTVTGLTQNTSYTFKVKAVNEAGESADSSPLTVKTNISVPNAPTGLVSLETTDKTVKLSWDNVSGATGYNVYKGSIKVNTLPITTLSYTVTGLTQNTAYSFTVKAINAGGVSAASAVLNVTTKSEFTIVNGVLIKYYGAGGAVIIPDNVTYIGEGAFSGCTGITSVTIPTGVTGVGSGAFKYCTNLISVNIPEGVASISDHAFCCCASLASVTIPGSCKSIGDYAFSMGVDDVTSLSSLTIKSGVVSIGNYAFYGCYPITDVSIPNSVTRIGEYAFGGCFRITNITLPDTITRIEDGTFSDCSGLKTITLPNSVTSIGSSAFSWCNSLTEITIPCNVASIEDKAFYACNSLAEVNFPEDIGSISLDAFTSTAWYSNQLDGLIYAGKVAYKYKGTMRANTSVVLKNDTIRIGSSVFADQMNLAVITIADSVKYIGNSAFAGCTGLSNVIIPDNVESIGSSAFADCSNLAGISGMDGVKCIGKSAFAGCESLSGITIPSGVERIEDSMFENCLSLTGISISDGIKYIGNLTFAGCESLSDISIPNNVESIGNGAFRDCYNLKNVSISTGSHLVSIGNSAFENDETLKRIDIPKCTTAFGYGIFRNCGAVTIYCTSGSAAQAYALDRNIKFYLTDIVHVTGIQINDTILNMLPGTTNSLMDSVLPYNAYNTGVVWGTSDPDVAIVSNEGLVTAKSQGTAIITVTTLEGGYSKSCKVTVSETLPAGIAAVQGSSTVIDREHRYIYGFSTAPASFVGSIKATGGAMLQADNSGGKVFGTGSTVNVVIDGRVVNTYIVVIFGDVNGDGIIDAADADKCIDVQNWKANWNHDTQEYYYKAGDINGDGNVDAIDADLISQTANWSMHIDQTTGLAVMN